MIRPLIFMAEYADRRYSVLMSYRYQVQILIYIYIFFLHCFRTCKLPRQHSRCQILFLTQGTLVNYIGIEKKYTSKKKKNIYIQAMEKITKTNNESVMYRN